MGKRSRGQRTRDVQAAVRREPSQMAPSGTHLGDFGQAREALDVTFGWFGATLRVHPDLTGLEQIDLVEQAMDLDETDPHVMTVLKDQLRAVVHDDDFDEFWRLARENRQRPDDLLRFEQDLFESLTGHPTGRQSGSSNGPTTTPPTSEDRSSALADRVVARLEAEGRADLAEVVLLRQESLAS